MSIESPGGGSQQIVEQFSELQLNDENNRNINLIVAAKPDSKIETFGDSFRCGLDLAMQSLPSKTNSSGCCSENESETSSLSYGLKKGEGAIPRLNKIKFEPEVSKKRAIRSVETIKRAVSLPRTSIQPTRYLSPLKPTNRTSSPQNGTTKEAQSAALASQSVSARLHTRTVKPQKPNSLPHVQSRTCKPQNFTPGKKSVGTICSAENTSSLRIRSSMLAVEVKSMSSSTSNPYGTVPRRRKQKSVEDLLNERSLESRSNSLSCEARMTSSICTTSGARKKLQLNCNSSNNSSAWTTPTQTHSIIWPNSNNIYNVNANVKAMPTTPARKSQSTPSKAQQKTKIYYEQSVQTTLTNEDMNKLFDEDYTGRRERGGRDKGRGRGDLLESGMEHTIMNYERCDKATQCGDIRCVEIDKLREEVRSLNASLQREREEKVILQGELQLNAERVMNMLELVRINSINGSSGMRGGGWTPTSEDDASTGTGSCSASGHESLLMLESQMQLSGHELVERQILQLRQLCRSLQSEMLRSAEAQHYLLQEKAAIEQESNEMQDFLQHEKTAMYDALREIEADFEACKVQLANRDDDLKALRDKCRYLVRLNEQRRQENFILQTKYSAFKSKSKDFFTQQHFAITAAFSSLSKLHVRLRSLVDELKLTYNISEEDLEVKINQQHETKSDENVVSKSCFNRNHYECALEIPMTDDDDGALSPQRHQSFIAAIISAIRGAATPSKRAINIERSMGNANGNGNGNGSNNANITDYVDGTDMLDSETEPCLMMDNVLEDVQIPDTHSHNMVSYTTTTTTTTTGTTPDLELLNVLNNEIAQEEHSSLYNLSQAIVNRQNIEMQTNDEIVDDIPDASTADFLDAKALVEKVSEIDTLVTRLLRLIQMDNDNCIQQLIVDKNKLQQHREEMLEKIRELQEVNIKLQDDLMDATQELMLKNNELAGKNDLQSHHNEIDMSMKRTSKMLPYRTIPLDGTENLNLSAEARCETSVSLQQNVNSSHSIPKDFDYEVMEVMDLLGKLQVVKQTNSNEAALTIANTHDVEGNQASNVPQDLTSPNQLETILNTFDAVDNLGDIDAEVQQTISKLKENWAALSFSAGDFIDANANAD